MNTIVIKTWRGLVSEVYADDKDTEVIVIDDEDEMPVDIKMPPHRIYH